MGREIRRVPRGWEHPRDERGQYRPLHDEDYETAAREWMDECLQWEAGTHPDQPCERFRYYWDWAGGPPAQEYYRLKWDTEPACYQIYETVSEGTPVSPVFESLDGMREWLVSQGYSEHAATRFVEVEWAPSLVLSSHTGILGIDIHAFDVLRGDAEG